MNRYINQKLIQFIFHFLVPFFKQKKIENIFHFITKNKKHFLKNFLFFQKKHFFLSIRFILKIELKKKLYKSGCPQIELKILEVRPFCTRGTFFKGNFLNFIFFVPFRHFIHFGKNVFQNQCSKNRFERVLVILQNKRCLSFIE